jgi:isoquinoline 1-oxidoreductase beta subunit
MSSILLLSRREAIKLFGLTAGALVLGGAKATLRSDSRALNLYVSINHDDTVTITCQRTEMGQGVRTSIPMLIADELEVDWKNVRVIQADGNVKYGDQNTDGSTSIQNNWMAAREMGATAKAMLISAAAVQFKCSDSDCRAKSGFVTNTKTGQKKSYAELAPGAATLSIPKNVKLKPESEFKLVGHPLPSPDLHNIVTGKAQYGIDVVVPNMLIASIERSRAIGGRVKSFDASQALKVPGVKAVYKLDAQPTANNTEAGVAVLATNTFAALKGREALKIEWDLTGAQKSSNDARLKELQASISQDGKVWRNDGDVKSSTTNSTHTADYYCPYLAHAPMEPPCATAHVTKTGCEIWAPVQDPQRVRTAAAKLLGIKEEQVTVHVTLLGGGFGRKSQHDFVIEAILLAKEAGLPVKVIFSREDDIRHGFFHADSLQQLTAGLDPSGLPISWKHKTAFPTCGLVFNAAATEAHDWELNQGPTNLPFDIPNVRVENCPISSPIKVGWLRSVNNIFHSFAINVFVDELAEKAKMDPVDYYLKLLGKPRLLENDTLEKKAAFKQDTARISACIKKVAEASQWYSPAPDGIFKGFASHHSFHTYAAAVAWVSVTASGEIQVKRIDLAVDCGRMINPGTVKAQMEGAVVFGTSAALFGQISLENGQVQQSNFHDYRVLRMNECPEIHIHLTESTQPPTGVGEPGVPPIAPAIANAVFRATKKRLRNLPLSL